MLQTRPRIVECSLYSLKATEHVILHWPGHARGALRATGAKMVVITRAEPRSACYAPLRSRRSHRIRSNNPLPHRNETYPVIIRIYPPNDQKYILVQIVLGGGAYVFDRAFASTHAPEIPAPRTLTWNPRVDPRLHTMMTCHIWSLDISSRVVPLYADPIAWIGRRVCR